MRSVCFSFRHAIRIVTLVIVKNVNMESTLITNTVDVWSAVPLISVTMEDADRKVSKQTFKETPSIHLHIRKLYQQKHILIKFILPH